MAESSTAAATPQISIPDPFTSMANKLNFLTLDVLVLVNLNCLHNYDWRTGFLLRCSMPLAIVLVIKAVATWRTHAALRQGPDQGFEPSTRYRTQGAASQKSLSAQADTLFRAHNVAATP